MTPEIKKIITKYSQGITHIEFTEDDLQQALIEICELQKQECANSFDFDYDQLIVLNTKNIAE